MKTLLLASALFAGLLVSVSAAPAPAPGPAPTPAPAPYHAFCKTLWLFATPCAQISTRLVKQIQAFSRPSGQYMLVSATPWSIIANHTSLDGTQAESITIKFNPTVQTGVCNVYAKSTSLGFTSLLDHGTNYCNLYNLLSASGLPSEPGFMEMTNEWACLGYALATCRT